MFQSDGAALSNVFMRFDLLGPTFVALEGLKYTEKSYLFKLSKKRFEFWYCDVHGIAYILDPRYIADGMPLPFREDIENKIFTHHLDDKDPSLEEKTNMYQEYTSFRSWAMQQRSSNSFKYQMLDEQRSTIFNFWDSHKQDWPMLARLELKVFSLAPSVVSEYWLSNWTVKMLPGTRRFGYILVRGLLILVMVCLGHTFPTGFSPSSTDTVS
jgi:hypothetical protein